MASVAFVATGLVAAGAIVQAAHAATFGPDSFLDIGGTIQKDALGSAGWSNAGTATSGNAVCANGGVHIAGSVGLFDCGALAGTSTTPFPVTNQAPSTNPTLNNANGVFQTQFTEDQLNSSYTTCPGGTQTGSNQFGGGEKFTDDPSTDSYSLGSVQSKDEISNVYAVARQNSSNEDEVYVGLERVDNSGDVHADFQFLQEPLAETTACSGTFSGGVHEQGDIVLEINFVNGGSTPSANVLLWSCTGSLTGTQAQVGTACRGTNPTAPYKNATWVSEPACPVASGLCYDPTAVSVATNNASIPCGAWVCRDSSGSPTATIPALEFMEGAVNLDRLGINLNCASTFFPITRSSGSGFTSQIESFAPPTKFNTCAGTTTTTSVSSGTVALGSSVTDTATVTRSFGNITPTGSVTWYACGPYATLPATNPVCTPTANNAVNAGSSSVPTGATSTTATFTSPLFTATAAGNWCFDAEYTAASGARLTNSNDQTTQLSTECFDVTALPLTIVTTPSPPNDTSIGNSWGDSAVVTGNASFGPPSGTASWTLCQETTVGTACSGGTPLGSTSTPSSTTSSSATYTLPAADKATPTAVGTWCFNMTFTSTSVDYQSGSASAECFAVTKAGSTSATTVSPTTLSLGPAGTIADTVTVTGDTAGGAPTGSVTFYVCGPSASFCDPSATEPLGNAVSLTAASGTTSTAQSSSFTPTAPGTWCFAAVYGGGTNYNGSSDNTSAVNADSAECATVNKAQSSVATTVYDVNTGQPWSGSETAPADAHDTATVTGVTGYVPTGTITYAFYNTGDCTGTSTTQKVNLSGGAVPNSSDTGALSKGSYSYLASYSGDGNYLPAPGVCEPFAVGLTPSSTSTAVFDGTTKAVWSGTEQTGATAYDTATVSAPGATPTGTVTYSFFANGTCSSPAVTTQAPVTLVGGKVPDSALTSALAAGSYSYQDAYSGDSNFAPSTGTCETFTVAKATPAPATTVFDAATNSAWAGTETTGASAYDTATVTGVAGFTPSGTVTYSFFASAECSGTAVFTDPETMAAGNVPHSSATNPLGAGSYSFQAVYGGDGNYNPATGSCEPFTVGKAASQTSTTVDDAATGNAWSGTETVGAQSFDTASVTGVTGFLPAGTVSYVFYPTADCSGTGSSPDQVTIQSGAVVPDSATSAALGAGSYSYLATYSGDANYSGSAASCEPLSVGKVTPALTTVVDDAQTHSAWGTDQSAGAEAQDTSTLTAVNGFPATGQVTYTLFDNANCSPEGSAAGGGAPTASGVPDSDPTAALAAGSYSYQASFAGDSNYGPVTADCEPFTVAPAGTSTATVVNDGSTNKPWSGAEMSGATAYDTATVSGGTAFPPTGQVTYNYFLNGTCSGTAQSSQTVNISGGSVPDSSTTSALPPGNYSYLTTYGGDANNSPSQAECETFTVAETLPTVTGVKSQNPPDGSVVGPGATVTYTIRLSNSGQAAATSVDVHDTVPTGTTFVSADNGGQLSGQTVTWPSLSIAGGSSVSVSFVVTVDSTTVRSETIPNTAQFTDVNTPGCQQAATCDTNTVTVHLVTTAPSTTSTSTTTSTVPAETTTTAATGSLVFTGSNVMTSVEVAAGACALGGILVLVARRRRRA